MVDEQSPDQPASVLPGLQPADGRGRGQRDRRGQRDQAGRRHGRQPAARPPELPDELTSVPVDAAFRSPYRFTGDTLLVVDQRQLPGQGTVIECRTADVAAAAIRAGAAGSGPVLGQIAAYAMVLAVKTSADRPTPGAPSRAANRRQHVACGPLQPARTAQRHRTDRGHRCVTPRRGGWHCPRRRPSRGGGGHRHRGRARPWPAGTGRRPVLEALVDALDSPPQSIDLLVHGDGGPSRAAWSVPPLPSSAPAVGRASHPRLADGGGADDGGRPKRRLAADRKRHSAHDRRRHGRCLVLSASRSRRLLRADWVCANGDIAAPLAVWLSRAGRRRGVPVFICAPQSVLDPV